MGSGKEGRRDRPRCVVIFASEDGTLAKRLSESISDMGYDGWSAHRIAQGKWPVAIENELATCDAVVPLVTKHTRSKAIFRDEWDRAAENKKPIFPFVIDPVGVPLGFGAFSRTDAPTWDGAPGNPAIDELRNRLRDHFSALGKVEDPVSEPKRSIATVGGKKLDLAAFVFSLSSFETQLNYLDGIDLIASLSPCATLVSAYDLYKHMARPSVQLINSIRQIRDSKTVLFLDSGNYEATRKDDYKALGNQAGWCAEKFWEVAKGFPADFVFSYDPPEIVKRSKGVLRDVVDRYVLDLQNSGIDSDSLCPIVHVPTDARGDGNVISSLIAAVASELSPPFIAIPERELGDGLVERMRSVKHIRTVLNAHSRYQPIHVLGTGNPVTVAALAASGADSFDGLEWCRTVANYETNSLMHFQQFDLLLEVFSGRMKSQAARALAEMTVAPFPLRAASYNLDYFEEWIKTVQRLLRSGNSDLLFKLVPTVGAGISRLLAEVSK